MTEANEGPRKHFDGANYDQLKAPVAEVAPVPEGEKKPWTPSAPPEAPIAKLPDIAIQDITDYN